MRIVLLALFVLTFISCAPKVSTQLKRTMPALPASAPVTVIGLKGEAPANATELGTVKIGDNGLSTDCGWNTVIEKAKQAARKAGGDIVKITKHTPPSILGSSCHQIMAKIMKADSNDTQPIVTTAAISGTETKPADYPRFTIGVQGGFSYMLAKISPNTPYDLVPYAKQLKSGSHIGAYGVWYFSETTGVGFKYSMFRSKNSMNIVAYDSSTSQMVTGKMSDDLKIQFIAPSFNNRFISRNKKIHYASSVAIGYLGYQNKATLINPFKLTGWTVGVHFSFGADFKLNKHWALGTELSYIGGALTSYTYDDGTNVEKVILPEGQKEGLSRMDLSIGIRCIL